ncbi:MAG: tetratricopeptide repeat protein [Dehalococcoidales bacterium]|nr:tetratricopeptide repeat protein [Dehalococcoidales bacterium]
MPKQSRKNQDAAELFAKNAEAYYHLENYDSAIKEMDKAISLEPRNSEYYFNRALAYNDSIGDYLTPDSFEKQSKKVKNRFQKSI